MNETLIGHEGLVCGSALGPLLQGLLPAGQAVVAANTAPEVRQALTQAGLECVAADVGEDTTLSPDDARLHLTDATRAVVVTHRFGRAGHLEPLQQLCRERGLALWEDASLALGATWEGRMLGTFGDLGWFTELPGYDGPFAAVVGLGEPTGELPAAALAALPETLEKRRRNAALYRRLLNPIKAQIPRDRMGMANSYSRLEIFLDGRDQILELLRAEGWEAAAAEPVAAGERAQAQAARGLILPNPAEATPESIRARCDKINRFLAGRLNA